MKARWRTSRQPSLEQNELFCCFSLLYIYSLWRCSWSIIQGRAQELAEGGGGGCGKSQTALLLKIFLGVRTRTYTYTSCKVHVHICSASFPPAFVSFDPATCIPTVKCIMLFPCISYTDSIYSCCSIAGGAC